MCIDIEICAQKSCWLIFALYLALYVFCFLASHHVPTKHKQSHAGRILINWFRRSINLGDNGYEGGAGVKGWGYFELAIQLL